MARHLVLHPLYYIFQTRTIMPLFIYFLIQTHKILFSSSPASCCHSNDQPKIPHLPLFLFFDFSLCMSLVHFLFQIYAQIYACVFYYIFYYLNLQLMYVFNCISISLCCVQRNTTSLIYMVFMYVFMFWFWFWYKYAFILILFNSLIPLIRNEY